MIALDSKILNEHPHENSYQMPNIGLLIQTIFQTLSNAKHETVFFQQMICKMLKANPVHTVIKPTFVILI